LLITSYQPRETFGRGKVKAELAFYANLKKLDIAA